MDQPSADPLVSIVIVSHNSRADLEPCFASIRAGTRLPHEIVVVDNASTDGTMATLAPRRPDVRWISNAGNPGFARANNQGLALARAPFWLVLNPDTVVRPGCLEALVDHLRAHAGVAVVGPEIERPDGRLEPSAGWVPTPRRELVETLLLFRLGLEGRLLRGGTAPVSEVDWVSGCAMLVRAEAARQVGHFDEHFFLYVEDMEWCWRFVRAGWAVHHLRGPRVLHRRGASVLASDVALVDDGDGFEYLIRKHGLAFPIPLARALRLGGLSSRAALLTWRGLRGDARARAEARIFRRSLAHALGLRRSGRPA